MTMLEFDRVSFGYVTGRPILRGIAFSLSPQEGVALLGRNGAGKTTAGRLAVGLEHPDEGSVVVDGETTEGRRPEQLAASIAYLSQNPERQLFARSVWDEVCFGRKWLGLDTDRGNAYVGRIMETLGIQDSAHIHPYDLSVAERRLVALAAAAVQESRVLILDEPTLGLDRTLSRRVGNLLRNLVAQGRAILVMTHDLGLVADYLERVLVLEGGRIVKDAPTSSVLYDFELLRTAGSEPPDGVRVSSLLELPGRPVKRDEVAAELGRLEPGG